MVRALLDGGADPNLLILDSHPLVKPALSDREDVVLALLKAGAQVNIRDKDEVPLLLRVSAVGLVRIASLLIDYGVDVNACSKVQ